MSIKDLAEKIKLFYYLILFVVIAGIFFALGRLSAIEERHSPIKIIQRPDTAADVVLPLSASSTSPNQNQTANAISTIGTTKNSTSAGTNSNSVTSASGGEVIGSKTGQKYYFPWCAGVKRIKPENQVTFASADLAKAAGYAPAGNCKGLQ
jgi:hypothetical protein